MPVSALPELTRNRVATFVFFGVQGFAFSLLTSKVSVIQTQLGLSDGTLSILLAVVPVLAGVGSVLAGTAMRWTTSATVLRIAEPTVIGVLILVPHTRTLWQAMPILMVFGLAVGAADATMNMQACGLERRYGRSIVLAFFGLWAAGAIVGSSWGALGSALGVHLSVIYLVAAVIGIAATLYAGPMLLKNLRDETIVKGADGKLPSVPWRPMLLLCAVMTLAYIGESTVTNAGSVYLTKGLESSDTLGGLVVGAYTLGQVLGRLRGDLLVQRYGSVKVVRAGAAVCALGFVIVVTAVGPYMALAGFLIAGVGLSPLVPQAFTTAHANDPAGSGIAVARINVFNYLGFLLGAPLVTTLWGAGVSHREGMAVPLVMIALIVLLAFAFDPRRVPGAGRGSGQGSGTGPGAARATPGVGGAETVPTLGS
ncbi:MFS transporter [Catenulispora yoronensis]|uniref:MFS transporter n=1 Tax=Catenulispora yoronensis TaxID=450799 RepID=A0ABN2UD26_9ACTN